jgi:hypothetical protein
MESAMTKTLLAVATALLSAMTLLASAAQANVKVRLDFGGPLPSFTAHGNSGGYRKPSRKKRVHRAHRRIEKTHKAARKVSPPANQVAKAVPEPATVGKDKRTERENSSISTAVLAPAKDDPPRIRNSTPKGSDAPDTLKKLSCKKFFPSVGMTLTIPCDPDATQ